MPEKESDKEFLQFVVEAIVANPKEVKIERTVDERGVLLTLHINSADIGFVIGKQGQTARALRTLLKIIGAKNNARVNLKIIEPEGVKKAKEQARKVEETQSPVDDFKI
ncbi:MAG: KH domain-containing protein [Patescibacteria group bacterium]